jgi:ribosomal protein S18 acetylase RimI-like enzyme
LATPEIAIGVEPEWRGCGVGSELLEALVGAATARGIVRLSLSVETDNPAMGLREKSWFSRLEFIIDSWMMVRDLEALAPPG